MSPTIYQINTLVPLAPRIAKKLGVKTYPGKNNIYLASRIDNRSLAAQLYDFAEHADDAVLELREVGREDAWGLGVVHCVLRMW